MRGVLLLLFVIAPLSSCLDLRPLLSRFSERQWRSKQYLGSHDLDTMFDGATFGMDGRDPCKEMTTERFKRWIKNEGPMCVSELCHNDEFSCPNHSNGDCFHVEHIVDRAGPEFTREPCNKDIAGNYVMAWGRWNSALGGHARTRLGYLEVVMEKTEVYGLERVLRARELIERCKPGCINDWKPPAL